MKSCVFLILSAIVAVGMVRSQKPFMNSTLDFTFDLLKELSKSPGNVAFSPTSISILLSILQQGAEGQTAEELTKVTHATPAESWAGFDRFIRIATQEKSEGSAAHQMATKIYKNMNFEMRPLFQREVGANFNVKVEDLNKDPGASADAINTWVSGATGGLVPEIITSDAINEQTALVLVSAMVFSGQWKKKFTDVRKEKFRLTKAHHIPLPFMISVQTLSAGREPNYKWIELPYTGEKYSMYIIKPTAAFKHNLAGLLETMDGSTLSKMIGATTQRKVYLRLPKFKIHHTAGVKEALQEMGLKTLFTDRAQLESIGPMMRVSDIRHEAHLDVHEEGTEAAAATGIIVHTLSANWHPTDLDFRLDEPFLAFIVNKEMGVPVFAARISNPAQ